jgi:hypothetical protein
MHQHLVAGVDVLELQLRRQLDENRDGAIRNTDPAKVPAVYRDSVAEYYRKLSGGGHQATPVTWRPQAGGWPLRWRGRAGTCA